VCGGGGCVLGVNVSVCGHVCVCVFVCARHCGCLCFCTCLCMCVYVCVRLCACVCLYLILFLRKDSRRGWGDWTAVNSRISRIPLVVWANRSGTRARWAGAWTV